MAFAVLAMLVGWLLVRPSWASKGTLAGASNAVSGAPRAGQAPNPNPVSVPAAAVPVPSPAALAALAPGACSTFAPLATARNRTIFVDPGHGGIDPGGSGTTTSGDVVQEKDVTLAVAQALLPLLRKDGFTVVLARTSDSTVIRPGPGDTTPEGLFTASGVRRDLEARVDCANRSHADVLVSIHMNNFGDPSIGGAETMYDSARPLHAQSARLASLVQHDLVAAFSAAGWSVPDRGTVDDSTLDVATLSPAAESYQHLLELGPSASGGLDRPSAMPGTLTEPLFLTSPAEADVASSDAGRAAIAAGLARAVEDYFSAKPAP